MTEREKVLLGLTCCANLDVWSDRSCHQCPYNCAGDENGGCEDHLIADAFAYIKALEKEMRELQHAPRYVNRADRQPKRDINLENGIMEDIWNG